VRAAIYDTHFPMRFHYIIVHIATHNNGTYRIVLIITNTIHMPVRITSSRCILQY
jgi:hypothetical protein